MNLTDLSEKYKKSKFQVDFAEQRSQKISGPKLEFSIIWKVSYRITWAKLRHFGAPYEDITSLLWQRWSNWPQIPQLSRFYRKNMSKNLRTVMSVKLPVKICFWFWKFAYVVEDVPSSLIVCISFMKRVLPFEQYFRRSSDSKIFPTFRICCNTSDVFTGRRIH